MSERDVDVTELRSRSGTDAVPLAAFALVVSEGPGKGLTATLDATSPTKLLVGHSDACGLVIPDRAVSRRHLALEVTELGLEVVDLGSRNGTMVNGVRVKHAVVEPGASIRIGDTTLLVEPRAPVASPRVSSAMRFGRIVGASLQMRRLYPLCEKVAASDVPCIIEGETGTGKEVLAESLHEKSPRANGPFIVFDCTAVPPTLFESALFGHEKGAFTGAQSMRKGALEQAHGGTLFIDEIGDLALPLQAKLLRVIERCEVQRVGATGWNRVDVRILAATRRDLEREVAEGRFRDDLFFRLAVTRVELPPLRERVGDVAILAQHFWRSLGGRDLPLPSGFVTKLESWSWPGNIRELRNVVARQLALGELADDEQAEDAVEAPPAATRTDDPFERVLSLELPLTRARQQIVEEFERRYVARVLDKHGGNVRKAAAASGIARRYFQVLKARQTDSD